MNIAAAERVRWIRTFRAPETSSVRVVCFPHAGGAATYFHPLTARLDASIELLAVQYPGRQERRGESLIDDIGVLADQVAAVLPPDGKPTMFFGHSMGATVAFETARRWEMLGRSPIRLIASGRRAPSLRARHTIALDTDRDVLTEIERLNGTDTRLLEDEEMLSVIIPVIRNDYRAVEAYRCAPGATVGCAVLAVRGASDPRVTAADMERWRDHTTGSFATHTFSGGHFYLESRFEELASVIEGSLTDRPRQES
ncbi:thioesterase II family protein [Nocardia sp. NPDC020380]|uniref:thioesterase II family protein n=1 Tax=Nocardia sp. NPDC020380 TaxID=3364309 RepID=UPI0037B16B71